MEPAKIIIKIRVQRPTPNVKANFPCRSLEKLEEPNIKSNTDLNDFSAAINSSGSEATFGVRLGPVRPPHLVEKNVRKNSNKTQKNHRCLSKKEKEKLWEVFDADINRNETDVLTTNSSGVRLGPNSSSLHSSAATFRVRLGPICIDEPNSKEVQSLFSKDAKNAKLRATQANQGGASKEIQTSSQLSDEDLSKKHSSHEFDICHMCKTCLIISEDGFPTCANKECAHINVKTLDYSPEWRFYGADDKNQSDPTRCGNPINPLLVESSFACKVLVSNSSTYEMRKIRKWTEWQSMPHREKSLYDEFQFITIMAQNAGIPKIFIDDAVAIHKDISEQKMFRGMNRDGIKSASIYISCRLNGCPRTAHEIAEIFRLDKASATAGCSTAVKILHNIERNYDPSQQTELGLTKPIAFIERFCSRLNINGELIMLSKFIAKKVDDQCIINNNTPHAVAAGIVFFISHNCQLNITKMDIKAICGVSEVTINKCFKKLELMKDQLIPRCVLEKYV